MAENGTMEHPALAGLESYLAGVDTATLGQDLVSLRAAARAGADQEDLRRLLYRALGGDRGPIAWVAQTGRYPIGTFFWRCRAFDDEAELKPAFTSHTGAWEPPAAARPSAGRVNRAGESLLYTCAVWPTAAPSEARVTDGAPFALMKYVAVREVTVADIRATSTFAPLSPAAQTAQAAVLKFYRDVFYGAGDEPGCYVLSELVAKDFFDLPNQDAWMYESVLARGELNVAFRADRAHDALRLVGVALQRSRDPRGVSAHTFGAVDGASFVWGPMGSPQQLDAFADFLSSTGA